MLREENVRPLTWADKTMSVLKERELEQCQKRLRQLPAISLFSSCSEEMAETFYASSYEAMEHPGSSKLHHLEDMRHQVLARIEAEAALLSLAEHSLVERMMIAKGHVVLEEEVELIASESLVRRFWCTISFQENDSIHLSMPETIQFALMPILFSPEHQSVRAKLMMYLMTLNSALYAAGMLPYFEPMAFLQEQVLDGPCANHPELVKRFLQIQCDYTYDRQGTLILLHPGLTDPDRFIQNGLPLFLPQTRNGEMHPEMVSHSPMEQDLLERMCGLLREAVRPELTEMLAARDLLMLAKQSVPFEEMEKVLSSLLMVQPTGAMLDGLKQMQQQASRWGVVQTSVVQ